jgi:hypothetical protein
MKPFAAALAKSKHAQVTCYQCHLTGGGWSYPGFKLNEWGPMLIGSLQDDKITGPSTDVSSARCLRCHEAVMDQVIEASGIRINHKMCAAGAARCTDCHAGTAHGSVTRWPSVPVMEDCVRCHIAQQAPTACDSCHRGRGQRERLMLGPWQITHGPNWSKTHGLGDLRDCQTCHRPDSCVKCHNTVLPHQADFGRTHGEEARKPGAKCLTCHDQKKLCDSCHGGEMPHPKAFLKQHSAIANTINDPACLKCHRVEDCRRCHVAHIHPGRTDGTLGKGPDGAIGLLQPRRPQ